MFHEPERRRPCICRGWITPQDPENPDAIAAAVGEHNATEGHLGWRHEAIMAGELVVPETPAETLRRHIGIPIPAVFRVERDRPVPPEESIPSGRAGWYADRWSTFDPMSTDDEPETIERALDGDR